MAGLLMLGCGFAGAVVGAAGSYLIDEALDSIDQLEANQEDIVYGFAQESLCETISRICGVFIRAIGGTVTTFGSMVAGFGCFGEDWPHAYSENYTTYWQGIKISFAGLSIMAAGNAIRFYADKTARNHLAQIQQAQLERKRDAFRYSASQRPRANSNRLQRKH
jgi:hypothetical protein